MNEYTTGSGDEASLSIGTLLENMEGGSTGTLLGNMEGGGSFTGDFEENV